MNERQQAMFLWDWSRKRRHGRAGIALLGAGIGAIGGLAFAAIMLYALTLDGATFSVNEDEMGGFFVLIARALGPTGFLFALSIPAFAALAAFVADRIWGVQEGVYHALLSQGARVPAAKPPTTWKDHAPRLTLLCGFGLLVIWVLYMAWWEINRGSL
ncbi:MAG: hypothetical protein H7124_12620 [Phycisphaerales bacterium]|nr:hypothetical protein [Hyphomonadaceae bacterium]